MSNANTIENPKIYGAIAGVIADCGFVGKDKVNKQQGFKYRSVDDVFNALHPALAQKQSCDRTDRSGEDMRGGSPYKKRDGTPKSCV